MKLRTLLAAALFITLNSTAQTYQPFPKDNVYWIYLTGYILHGQSTPDYGYIYHQYMLKGDDTVLNNKTYKLIHRRRFVDSNKYHTNKIYAPSFHNRIANVPDDVIGGIREDSQKVYIKYFDSNPEVLYYDFTLKVNDSFADPIYTYLNLKTAIIKIDSVLVGSNYHKRYHGQTSSTLEIIEGIGNTHEFYPSLIGQDYGYMVCYNSTQYGTYHSDSTNVFYIHPYGTPASVEKTAERTKLSIAPNPFTNTVRITAASVVKLSVYNIVGKLICTYNKVKNIDIETGSWAKGMYYLVGEDVSTGAVRTERVVKR
ncbi:MAG: T9SS type A sorting domain-containing protein [Chitinophagales bacterium]|nr:T9SS type A sorting domain-containing protein [Chitinophagaceae bacterium]MCB9065607.1 T9SS type A sorting domain-containing protein [Chitinophagales bacterium]